MLVVGGDEALEFLEPVEDDVDLGGRHLRFDGLDRKKMLAIGCYFTTSGEWFQAFE